MPDQDSSVHITGMDHTPDMLFVSFTNGETVTYNAAFLFSVREQDHNTVITTEADPMRDRGMEPGPAPRPMGRQDRD